MSPPHGQLATGSSACRVPANNALFLCLKLFLLLTLQYTQALVQQQYSKPAPRRTRSTARSRSTAPRSFVSKVRGGYRGRQCNFAPISLRCATSPYYCSTPQY